MNKVPLNLLSVALMIRIRAIPNSLFSAEDVS
jgi:hypothetical protein